MILAFAVFIALIVVICALLLTVIMHLWLGVPYVPTPWVIADEMVSLGRVADGDTVMDLGAGDGRVLVAAKRRFPGIRAVGCELVPTIWLLGVVYRACIRAPKVEVRLGDAFKQDLREVDVLLVYLIPGIMTALVPKFERELKPGTRIVSHAFRLPGREPKETRQVERWGRMSSVYLYEW